MYLVLYKLNRILIDLGCVFLKIVRSRMILKDCRWLKRNKLLKNEKKTETCYVIGLGPSLREIDISNIREDIIVVNKFYEYDKLKKIKPRFYCLFDQGIYLDDNDILKRAYESYPETIFLLNGKYRKEAEKIIGRKSNVYYIYGWEGVLKGNEKIDLCKNMPLATNVICRAIEVAVYLCYKEVRLLGCDFNSFAFENESHCYEEDSKKTMSKAFELFCYSFSAEEHIQLAKIAKAMDIDIINMTKGSLIDAYKKSEYIE